MAHTTRTADRLGKIGLSLPLHEITSRKWDCIIIGAGHNGLTCAAYLAKSGKKVLVLESRETVGGACTLEEPWPGYKVSPCAYSVGLFHPKIVHDLRLKENGLEWKIASGGTFVPFEDGSSIQLHDDDALCEAEIKRFAPYDYDGWRAMIALKKRLRDILRPNNDRDLWLHPAPTREKLEALLVKDKEAHSLLFEWSMAEFLEHYIKDERLQAAYMGQGVIGTKASPFDKGTASVHFHHNSGHLDGIPGSWGYIKGGMGMLSYILCDVAMNLGVCVATGSRVAEITPGSGVRLESGEKIEGKAIVSNADPRVTLNLLGANVDSGWKAKIESVPIQGCTVKVNLAIRELPNFRSRPGLNEPHHKAQINAPLNKAEWKASFEACQRGEISEKLWCEIYLHSVFDPTIAPKDMHTMSVFSQFVPYQFANGDWDTRRNEVKEAVLRSIGRFCSNFPDVIVHEETLGPPDIEKRVGLTGGHIFQGEILPQYMWDKRLPQRTPMPGFFMCGAGTYPGGSVMGVNGRLAAMEVLRVV